MAPSSSGKARTPSQSHPFRVIEPDMRSQGPAANYICNFLIPLFVEVVTITRIGVQRTSFVLGPAGVGGLEVRAEQVLPRPILVSPQEAQ